MFDYHNNKDEYVKFYIKSELNRYKGKLDNIFIIIGSTQFTVTLVISIYYNILSLLIGFTLWLAIYILETSILRNMLIHRKCKSLSAVNRKTELLLQYNTLVLDQQREIESIHNNFILKKCNYDEKLVKIYKEQQGTTRRCFNCCIFISFEDFITINSFPIGMEQCLKLWSNNIVQFYCCKCFYKFEKENKIIKNIDLNIK